jgi:hypothetical protein
MTQVLAAVLARGGAAGTAGWLIFVATPQELDDGSPAPPPSPAGDPPYNPNPPANMPGAWNMPIAAAAERISALNPSLAIDAARVEAIAKRCLWLAAQARRPLSDCGKPGLPVFVVGREYPQATDHMLQGLGHHAAWFRLTYLDRARTSWYWSHPETEPGGAAECRGTETISACDEFPWQKTEQGGERANPLPHLKIIDFAQNSGSGGLFGRFVTTCRVAARKAHPDPRYGKGNFLVVPLPAAMDPAPSVSICNGPSP